MFQNTFIIQRVWATSRRPRDPPGGRPGPAPGTPARPPPQDTWPRPTAALRPAWQTMTSNKGERLRQAIRLSAKPTNCFLGYPKDAKSFSVMEDHSKKTYKRHLWGAQRSAIMVKELSGFYIKVSDLLFLSSAVIIPCLFTNTVFR